MSTCPLLIYQQRIKQSSLQGHQLTGTILISKHAPMIEGHTEDD